MRFILKTLSEVAPNVWTNYTLFSIYKGAKDIKYDVTIE